MFLLAMQVNAGTAGHCSYFLVCVSTFLFAFEYSPKDQGLKSGSTSWSFLRSLEEYQVPGECCALQREGGAGGRPEVQSFTSFLGFKDGFNTIFRIQKETKKCPSAVDEVISIFLPLPAVLHGRSEEHQGLLLFQVGQILPRFTKHNHSSQGGHATNQSNLRVFNLKCHHCGRELRAPAGHREGDALIGWTLIQDD